MDNWADFEIKPILTRSQKYISIQPNSFSNNASKNAINRMIIDINGEKYRLCKLNIPTRRNGGKHRGKKRRTRKH